MNELTQKRLKEVLNYDPKTGNFTRLVRTARNTHIGQITGSINNEGYIQIGIDNKVYKAHRLAVLYMTGKWPKIHVDHINGIRADNRWLNLRECDDLQNLQNCKTAQKNNKSTGLLGVSDSPNRDGRFQARIMLKGKSMHLGTFKTAEEAHEKYLEVKREIHGFNTL